IEISKRVRFSKVGPSLGEFLIARAPQDFRSAQTVFNRLAYQFAQKQSEKTVPNQIEKSHGLGIHCVDQAASVHEFSFAADERLVEVHEILRRHAEVGVKDHEDVSFGA